MIVNPLLDFREVVCDLRHTDLIDMICHNGRGGKWSNRLDLYRRDVYNRYSEGQPAWATGRSRKGEMMLTQTAEILEAKQDAGRDAYLWARSSTGDVYLWDSFEVGDGDDEGKHALRRWKVSIEVHDELVETGECE